MNRISETNRLIIRRPIVAYRMQGQGTATRAELLVEALDHTFPEGNPLTFRQLHISFALPEEWRTNEPGGRPEDDMRTLTEILTDAVPSRCGSPIVTVEKRYGDDAGTEAVMSALHTMTVDERFDGLVVATADMNSNGLSRPKNGFGAVGAALLFTRTGTPTGQVCLIGAHQVHHKAMPSHGDALSMAIGGALERSGSTMADMEAIAVSAAGSLTQNEVRAAARSLCSSWDGEFHDELHHSPLGAAAGAFDLSYEAVFLRYYAMNGQRFMWVSRTADSTCAAVLRQDGRRDVV